MTLSASHEYARHLSRAWKEGFKPLTRQQFDKLVASFK